MTHCIWPVFTMNTVKIVAASVLFTDLIQLRKLYYIGQPWGRSMF